MSSIYNT